MTGMSEKDRIAGQRLLAHIQATETRWYKVTCALLNFGRWHVPEDREPYNPVQRLAAKIGVWMDEIQTDAVNDLFDEQHGLGKYARGR